MMRAICLVLTAVFLLLGAVGCKSGSQAVFLPKEGYDYREQCGVLFGYRIPMIGDNPMCTALDGKNTVPTDINAYVYQIEEDAFSLAAVEMMPLHLSLYDKNFNQTLHDKNFNQTLQDINLNQTLQDIEFNKNLPEMDLTQGQDIILSVPCVKVGEDETQPVFFASTVEGEQLPFPAVIAEGSVSDCAVVSVGTCLCLADAEHCTVLTHTLGTVFSVLSEEDRILYSDQNGSLYDYCGKDGSTRCVYQYQGRSYPDDVEGSQNSGSIGVTDAWYAADLDSVSDFKGSADMLIIYQTADGTWYHTEVVYDTAGILDTELPRMECIFPEPPDGGELWSCVLVRDTAAALCGNDDTSYFYHVCSGERVPMDVGGLYRFRFSSSGANGSGNSHMVDTTALPLSPDGVFVYLYDIDFIYRVNLFTGDLSLAYNEAPILENACILHSLTAVTDEFVLLSQKASEHTEHAAVITVALFEEDVPEVRHEYEKIDVDVMEADS
ncbi:MAG: hypothetical protein J6I50_05400 [Clostridia bacterium]|nr:hypothetical protein [Clostridia bacterium]